MTKEPIRRSILVNEAQFEAFDQRRKALDMNSSELLQTLLQEDVVRTETTMIHRVEQVGDFDNEVRKMAKKVGDK
jgi:hypothetical protein